MTKRRADMLPPHDAWWSVGRLTGTVVPLLWLPAPSYLEARLWTAVHTGLRPEELVLEPVWVGHLPAQADKNPRKLRSDFEARRLALLAAREEEK